MITNNPISNPQSPTTKLPLWAIIALAVLLRLASALYQGDVIAALPGIHDQFSYDALARRVLAGHGFSFATDWWPATRAGEPTAHWSYLYTLYLAGVYALFGPHPLAARLIQAVLAGVLHPWLTWRIAGRVFGPPSILPDSGGEVGQRVALVAAALTAVYAYFVYYAGALMTETFYIIAILWALDLAMLIADRGSRIADRLSPMAEHGAQTSTRQLAGASDVQSSIGDPPSAISDSQSAISDPPSATYEWVLLGLALGIAALLRQVILLFVPFLLAWLLWTLRKSRMADRKLQVAYFDTQYAARDARFLIRNFLLSVAIIVAMIIPWSVRNYRAFGRFVLLNTNAGYAFFWANHPIYGTHFVGILPPDGPSYQDLIPTELRGLDEAALDQALLHEGLRFVIEDPARYVLLSISRLGEYFKFWPSSESSFISNISRSVSFGLALPFIIYGLWLSVTNRSRLHHVRSVTLLYLFVVIYSLIHLLSWSLIRYRLPVDAVLILFAGVAVVDLAARMTRSKRALIQVQR